MSLERVVARGTARGLINGSASPSYEMVISLYKVLVLEGDAVLAAGLLDLVASPSNGRPSRLVSAKSYCATSALVRFCSGCSCMGYRVGGDPFSSKCRSRFVSAVEPGAWGFMSGSTCASRESLSFACPTRSSLARTLFRLFIALICFSVASCGVSPKRPNN